MSLDPTPLTPVPGIDLDFYPPLAGSPALAADIVDGQQRTVNAISQVYFDGYVGNGFPTPITRVASAAALRALTGMVNGAVVIMDRAMWRFYSGSSASNGFDAQVADDSSGLWVRLEVANSTELHGTPSATPEDVRVVPMSGGRAYAVSLGSQVAINHAAGTPGTAYTTGSPTVVMSCQAPAVAFADAVRIGDIITCDVALYLAYTYVSGTTAELSTIVSVAFILGGTTVDTQVMSDAVSVASVYDGTPIMPKILSAQFSYTAASAATSATCAVSVQKGTPALGDASTQLHPVYPSNMRVSVGRP